MTKQELLKFYIGLGCHIFPITPLQKAPPKVESWTRESSDDAGRVKQWYNRHKNANWGMDCGKSDRTILDVDPRNGGRESLARLEKKYGLLPATLTVDTPSGGQHYYFRGSVPSRKLVGFPGIDLKSIGGYVVIPPSEIDLIGDYRIARALPEADVPKWLLEMVGEAGDRRKRETVVLSEDAPADIERARAWLETTAPESIEGEGGNDNAFEVACRVKDLGVSEGRCLDLMLGGWNERCEPPWDFAELSVVVENAYNYGQDDQGSMSVTQDFDDDATDRLPTKAEIENMRRREAEADPGDAITELNKKHSKVVSGNKVLIYKLAQDTGEYMWRLFPREQFDQIYEHVKSPAPGSKDTDKLGPYWRGHSCHMRSTGSIIDRRLPSGPQGMNKPFNLWTGGLEPASGDWSSYERLIYDGLSGGDGPYAEYILDWCALLIQRPEVMHKVALIFRGGKGTGKTTLVKALGLLLGSHYQPATTMRDLTDKFNWHYRAACLIGVEEGAMNGSKSAEARLKATITDSPLRFEDKGTSALKLKNYASVIIYTNEDQTVPASFDERRYGVFGANRFVENDNPFWKSIYQSRGGLKRGPVAAFGHELMRRDISGFEPIGHCPYTQGLEDQIVSSLGGIEGLWFKVLDNGGIPFEGLIGAENEDWHSGGMWLNKVATLEYVERWLVAQKNLETVSLTMLTRTLKKYGVSVKEVGKRFECESRRKEYFAPRLAIARAAFEKAVGRSIWK
jgi:hypothetical protein